MPARIDDGDPEFDGDDWFWHNKRIGDQVRVRADRWYQSDPSDSEQEKIRPDIRCNIWERATVRRDMLHSLSSGETHNSGYDALQGESILHGDAGVYGKYSVLQVLPDKIGRFLFEYHSELFNSLNLPDLPSGRSSVDVHRLLDPKQVCNHMGIMYAYFTYSAYFTNFTYFTYLFMYLHILQILYILHILHILLFKYAFY